MKIAKLGLASLVAASLITTPARAEEPECVTAKEVEAVVLTFMPDALNVAAEICTPHLPEGAMFAQKNPPIAARYAAEQESVWPDARSALRKIVGADAAPLLDEAEMRDRLFTELVPALSGAIRPKDCPAINHMMELLEPLPPRNMAGIFSTILQLSEDGKRRDGKPVRNPRICPADFNQ